MLRLGATLFYSLGLLSALSAAPIPSRPPAYSNEQEARNFAAEIRSMATMIAREYVREVSRNDLYIAALQGVYEAGRSELPAEIITQLNNARDATELDNLLFDARRKLRNTPGIEGRKGILVGVQAMSRALDPYSTIVLSNDFQRRGDVGYGFGFELDGPPLEQSVGLRRFPEQGFPEQGGVPFIPFRVTRVIPGSPAQHAGLLPGDLISQIDDREVTADSAKAIHQSVLLSPVDPTRPAIHSFVIQRQGRNSPFTLKMNAQAFVPETIYGVQRELSNSWNFWLDAERTLACIRVGPIETNTTQQLVDALASVRGTRGLILDLRWCPGGYLNQSTEIAAMFMDKGEVARVQYRNADRMGPGRFSAEDVGITRYRAGKYPVIVLVNNETKGGGELIAAALQDHQRVKIAGQRTHGKASVQTPIYIPFAPELTFKVTAGTFVRPNGKNLQRFPDSKPDEDWGVHPDKGYELPVSASLSAQLQDWHLAMTLRPGTNRESVALDDPEGDVQRFAAQRLLRKWLETENAGGKR